jgi:ABC-2 type transport system permease protein
MTTLTHAVADSATMLRRSLRHSVRYPITVVMSLGVPVMMLLLFVGIFGGTLGAGMGASGNYVDYVVPGILLMTAGYGAQSTAMAVNRDMTEGIVDRFRTMAISRVSVLTGHVVGALVRSLLSLVLVIGVALLLGFGPDAGPVEWLATLGLLALLVFALTWLAVGVGMAAKTAEGTSSFTLVVQVLPFVSSAFVPPESMSAPVRWFAEHEPFTPIIDTLRALLTGAPVGGDGPVAVAWCVGIAFGGYLWARAMFNRER